MAAAPPVREKLRLVLDYLPCEACLEVHVDDQDLHCSLCRRLARVVDVTSRTDVKVVVESPALPLPVEVPPAPEATVVPPPAPVEAAAAEVAAEEVAVDAPIAAEAAPSDEAEDEDDVDVGFGRSEAADDADEDVDLGFEVAREAGPDDEPSFAFDATEAPQPDDEDEPPRETPLREGWTFPPESLAPEDADALEREAEAWAEATAEEEEVELVPVTADELAAERTPEPEPWPDAAPAAASGPLAEPDEAWPEEAPADDVEVLEIVEEEPIEEDALPPAGGFEPPAEPEVAALEVLEVVEEEPDEAPAPQPQPAWQDDPWPEEPPLEAPARPALGPEPALAPEPEEAWPDGTADEPPAADGETWTDAGAEPLTLVDGVGPAEADRLAALGLRAVPDVAGRDAKELAKAADLPAKLAKRVVAVAQLHAHGVPAPYADALVEAGYDSVRALRRGKPEKVARTVNEVLAKRGSALEPVDADRVGAWQAA